MYRYVLSLKVYTFALFVTHSQTLIINHSKLLEYEPGHPVIAFVKIDQGIAHAAVVVLGLYATHALPVHYDEVSSPMRQTRSAWPASRMPSE